MSLLSYRYKKDVLGRLFSLSRGEVKIYRSRLFLLANNQSNK